MKRRSAPEFAPALIFDVPADVAPVSSSTKLVCSAPDTRSSTNSSPESELRKEGGRRRISALRRAPAFA
jgi:hypothetical protein